MLGDSIAILDGFDLSSVDISPDAADGRIGQVRAGVPGYFGAYDVSPDDADGRIGQVRAFPNYGAAKPIGPGMLERKNMIQASGGGNYAGGSSWYPGAPTMPASAGLAGFAAAHAAYGRAGLGAAHPAYGRAGLGAAHPAYGRAGLGVCGGGCGTMADADLAAAFEAYDVSPDDADGRIGQTRAFPNQYATPIMPGVLRKLNMIDPSGGANYTGGSSFAPGNPLMPSSVGLAGDMSPDQDLVDFMNARDGRSGPLPGVLTQKINVVDPSGGANYTGGASFAPGMPLLVSSSGLAELSSLDALDSKKPRAFNLSADGRAFFDKLAGQAVIRDLKAKARLANAQRNLAVVATLGRQMAIARRLRRALFALKAAAPITAAQVSQLAAKIAQQVAADKKVAVAA